LRRVHGGECLLGNRGNRTWNPEAAMSDVRIESLHVYPVKGCRGIALDVADVATTGLVASGAGDREWMIVDSAGRFVTQREHPRLALVGTQVRDGFLTLSAPGVAPLVLPLRAPGGPSGDVVVWRSAVKGFDAGDDAARWLSVHVGAGVRLVRFDRALARPCNPDYAGDSGAHTLFADGYPILVIGAASLADLNARLAGQGGLPLPMNRFRPNVVLAGLPPYDEDHVATIAFGDIVLRCVKPCTRCQVTTTNQDTADVGVEPLRTLAGYRMSVRLAGVTFGMNAVVVGGAGGTLAAGAPAGVEYAF
jgi:uncharacterized protein